MIRSSGIQRSAHRAAGSITGLLLAIALSARPVLAHGGATGARDLVQDYGVLIFLVAIVLIGAGVLVWVMLSPASSSDASEARDATPPAGTG